MTFTDLKKNSIYELTREVERFCDDLLEEFFAIETEEDYYDKKYWTDLAIRNQEIIDELKSRITIQDAKNIL